MSTISVSAPTIKTKNEELISKLIEKNDELFADNASFRNKIARLEGEHADMSHKYQKARSRITTIENQLADMSHKYQKTRSRITTIENQLADKTQECEAQKQTIAELRTELYTEAGPNAPPSKKIKKKRRCRRSGSGRKGGQVGHKGTTRKRHIDRVIQSVFVVCSDCNSMHFRVTETKPRTITEHKTTTRTYKYQEATAVCVGCSRESKSTVYEHDIWSDQQHSDAPIVEIAPNYNESNADSMPGSADCSTNDAPESGSDQIYKPGRIIQAISPQRQAELGKPHQIPKKGSLGFSVLTLVVTAWLERVVLRGVDKIQREISDLSGISPATVNAILHRTADALKPVEDSILDRLLKSSYLHIDETTLIINGVRRYVWVLATKTDVYLFTHSRSPDKVWKILEKYTGCAILDGYKTISRLQEFQRCWAHVIRDVRYLNRMLDTKQTQQFEDDICKIFRSAVTSKLKGNGKKTHKWYAARLDKICSKYAGIPEMKKVVQTVQNAKPNLFTFLLYDEVDPTNNLAERLLREVVKHRVMRVAFQTQEGADMFATLIGIKLTAHLRGWEIAPLLKKYL